MAKPHPPREKNEAAYTVSLAFANIIRKASGNDLFEAISKLDLTGFKVKAILRVTKDGKSAAVPAIPFFIKRLKASSISRELLMSRINKAMR